MSLAGASAFDLSAEEIAAIYTGATGPMTDAGVKTITAQNFTLNANGQISTSNANGVDIAVPKLSTNTTCNANAFVRTGVINMGVGTGGSSVGSGTLDLTVTGAVTQTAGTGNAKTLANAGEPSC